MEKLEANCFGENAEGGLDGKVGMNQIDEDVECGSKDLGL